MNDQKTAIKARGLRKTFGSVVAVDGIDIDVRAGEIYGFLGPNGAGKTTTIKLLTGVLTPDEGEIEILGENLHDNELAIKRQIGVVPDDPHPILSCLLEGQTLLVMLWLILWFPDLVRGVPQFWIRNL